MSNSCKALPLLQQDEVLAIVNRLYQRLPPVWPLNASVAVNPWHFSTHEKIEQTFPFLQTFSRANTLPKHLEASLYPNKLKKVYSTIEFLD